MRMSAGCQPTIEMGVSYPTRAIEDVYVAADRTILLRSCDASPLMSTTCQISPDTPRPNRVDQAHPQTYLSALF
jgi:hypothetical protein